MVRALVAVCIGIALQGLDRRCVGVCVQLCIRFFVCRVCVFGCELVRACVRLFVWSFVLVFAIGACCCVCVCVCLWL
jgi:hypothetical protein